MEGLEGTTMSCLHALTTQGPTSNFALALSRSSILAEASVLNLDFHTCLEMTEDCTSGWLRQNFATCASALALLIAFCRSALASVSASIFSRNLSRSASRARNLPSKLERSRASASAMRRVSSSWKVDFRIGHHDCSPKIAPGWRVKSWACRATSADSRFPRSASPDRPFRSPTSSWRCQRQWGTAEDSPDADRHRQSRPGAACSPCPKRPERRVVPTVKLAWVHSSHSPSPSSSLPRRPWCRSAPPWARSFAVQPFFRERQIFSWIDFWGHGRGNLLHLSLVHLINLISQIGNDRVVLLSQPG